MSEWLTSAEAAAILKVKPSTLAKWRQLSSRGCFKGPRFSAALGRDVRYRRDELEAWLEASMARSTVEAKMLKPAPRKRRVDGSWQDCECPPSDAPLYEGESP